MKTTEVLHIAWKTRKAWWFTASAKTRERFVRTTLGSFWLGLSNLLSIAVLATVYGTVFKVKDFNSYVVFLGIGLVTWNAIAGSIQSAPTLLRSNAGNIKNNNLHPIYYTLEEWSFQLQTFGQSFSLVLIALAVFNFGIIPNLVVAGIMPLVNLLLFIYWFPLLICVLGSKYEDLYQLIPIVLQLMFLLSPILYRKEALGKMSWTADYNPLYIILSNFRDALISGEANKKEILIIMFINVIGLYVSIKTLEKERKVLPFIL